MPVPLDYETPAEPAPHRLDPEAAFRRANDGVGGSAAFGVVILVVCGVLGIDVVGDLPSNDAFVSLLMIAPFGVVALLLLRNGLRRLRER